MGYKLTSNYRWYLVPEEPPVFSRIYYIENVPYDVDILKKEDHLDKLTQANANKGIKADDLFKGSDYLIAEMMHPLLFELEIDNPEELPTDYAAET